MKTTNRGDLVLRKLRVSAQHFTETLVVRMIQLTTWPLQGLPHSSAIIALIDKLTNALMASSTKQTVVMCRYANHLLVLIISLNDAQSSELKLLLIQHPLLIGTPLIIIKASRALLFTLIKVLVQLEYFYILPKRFIVSLHIATYSIQLVYLPPPLSPCYPALQ